MKSSLLLASIGNAALLGGPVTRVADPLHTSLLWLGLLGLALLTLRSERWRLPEQRAR